MLYGAPPYCASVCEKLEQAGFDLETSVKSAKTLRKHLGRAAKEVSRAVFGPLRSGVRTRVNEGVRCRCVFGITSLGA